MKVRSFYTTGKQDIIEWEYDKPDITDDEIEVRSIFTGMCSSDVAMYNGKFQTLPKEIQGHEGLGEVLRIGKHVVDIAPGDFVATRGEPAFADIYNCDQACAVVVPEANPKYILEPVACAVNIADAALNMMHWSPILILGSGWLATAIHKILYTENNCCSDITVVGAANADYWKSAGVPQIDEQKLLGTSWKNVIDLSDKSVYYDYNLFADNARLIMAAEKSTKIQTDFSEFLWKGMNISCPSPRNDTFYRKMHVAKDFVADGVIETEKMWTHRYKRDNVVEAFKEASDRPANYKRGYIAWPT